MRLFKEWNTEKWQIVNKICPESDTTRYPKGTIRINDHYIYIPKEQKKNIKQIPDIYAKKIELELKNIETLRAKIEDRRKAINHLIEKAINDL